MNAKPENKIISDDEINLYDYWAIIVERKKLLFGVFFIPVIVAIIIALITPRYYRGEGEITLISIPANAINYSGESSSVPIIPTQEVIELVGNIENAKKNKIFTKNSSGIKNVSLSLSKKSTNKISVIIDAKTADILPIAFNDIFNYIHNIPEIKNNIDKINKEIDFKIQKITEAKKANLTLLNHITDSMKKKQITAININPADLIKKDFEMSIDIKNLEQVKSDTILKEQLNVKHAVILSPLSITKMPTGKKIKQSIILTGIMSLIASILIVFLFDYFKRMKMLKRK